MQLACELSLIDLMMVGYEFCGGYRLDKENDPEQGFRKEPALTSVAKLNSFVARATGLKGCKNARKALRYIADGADSPMETALTLLLCLPYRHGGYGFALPRLNYHIEVDLPAGKQTYRGDLYWPKERVDIEYDSDTYHATTERINRDATRRTHLSLAGVSVITVTRTQIMNVARMRVVAELLSKKLKKRLRYSPEFILRQFELRKQLLYFCIRKRRSPG